MTVLTPERAASVPAPAGAGVPAGGRRGRGRAGLVLAAPFAVLLTATVLVPIGYALYLSLFTDRLSGLGFSGPAQAFIALGNYVDVVTDSAFHASLGNVALFVLVHIPIMLGLALVLALLIDSAVVRLRRLWSLAVFLPYAVPTVITG
ncbi:MAG TPA: sugar ABC transporter permease, partial [Amycolatopsis sp.]|nr:sugar ABC transporter permease [Amycolatopsis sp.]